MAGAAVLHGNRGTAALYHSHGNDSRIHAEGKVLYCAHDAPATGYAPVFDLADLWIGGPESRCPGASPVGDGTAVASAGAVAVVRVPGTPPGRGAHARRASHAAAHFRRRMAEPPGGGLLLAGSFGHGRVYRTTVRGRDPHLVRLQHSPRSPCVLLIRPSARGPAPVAAAVTPRTALRLEAAFHNGGGLTRRRPYLDWRTNLEV